VVITMPESFDGMLADLADVAAAAIPLPDVASVRRRARERKAHRRMAVSALALVLLGTCGGTLAAVSGRFMPKPRSEIGAVAPGSTAAVSSAGTSSPGPGGRSATPTPDASAAGSTAAYKDVAGVWQPVGGGEYLIVFPDGEVGLGQKGAWQLCDGHLGGLVAGDAFTVDQLACSDYGTTGLTLRAVIPGKELALAVPSGSGQTAYTVQYQRTDAALVQSPDQAIAMKLAGDWSSMGVDKRSLLVTGNGVVSLLGFSSDGGTVHASGTITGFYGDGARVEIPCAVKPGEQTGGECGVLELQLLNAKEIAVVGSSGSETFILTTGGPLFAGGTQSVDPASTRRPPASADSLTQGGATPTP
jgi:hypothetical protein